MTASNPRKSRIHVRPIERRDLESWLPLRAGYNAFYGRTGPTALADEITRSTWERFFDPAEPMRALGAESEGRLVGIAHCIWASSSTTGSCEHMGKWTSTFAAFAIFFAGAATAGALLRFLASAEAAPTIEKAGLAPPRR